MAVPSFTPWQEYQRRDARLWLRWAEPWETGLGGPRLEVAAAPRSDEETGTAWVVARSGPLIPHGSRAVYSIIEAQGLVDLIDLDQAELDSPSPRHMHWLACVDLTRRSEE